MSGTNPRIWKWNTKLILDLCINYMVHVFSVMWRIKNQPSNFTSCSDNALRLLVLVAGIVYWGFQVIVFIFNLGCIVKGCFKRGLFWRPKSRLKGIEDFNLKHWSSMHALTKRGFESGERGSQPWPGSTSEVRYTYEHIFKSCNEWQCLWAALQQFK